MAKIVRQFCASGWAVSSLLAGMVVATGCDGQTNKAGSVDNGRESPGFSRSGLVVELQGWMLRSSTS